MLEANLANSKLTLATVSKLLKESSDKALKKCLGVCAEEYDTAANDDFPTAIQSLEINDLGTAKIHVSAAFDAPGNCRDTFSEVPGVQAPPDLSKLNDYFEQLSVTALIMLNNLG
jgi:pectinesterase inhibitor-like protein